MGDNKRFDKRQLSVGRKADFDELPNDIKILHLHSRLKALEKRVAAVERDADPIRRIGEGE